MKFERESYRKLYVRESADDRMKPVFQRGLRDYLLRQAKDDGTLLQSTRKPVDDLGRALAIHQSERKAFKEYVDDMIESGYLTYEGHRLWITRFEEAQESRSKGAARQEKYLANKKAREAAEKVSGDAKDDVTNDESSDVTGDAKDDVTINRRDETRRDDPKAPEGGDGRSAEPPGPNDPIPCPLDLSLAPEQRKTHETAQATAVQERGGTTRRAKRPEGKSLARHRGASSILPLPAPAEKAGPSISVSASMMQAMCGPFRSLVRRAIPSSILPICLSRHQERQPSPA
jgi:hypothetical protein